MLTKTQLPNESLLQNKPSLLLFITLGLISGITLGEQINIPWIILLVISISSVVLSSFFQKKHLLLVILPFICLGIYLKVSFHSNPDQQSGNTDFIGYIEQHPTTNINGTLKLQSKSLKEDSQNTSVLLYLKPRNQSFSIGDVIHVRAYFKPIPAPTNPYQFDYKTYCKNKGIYRQAFINKKNTIEKHPQKHLNLFLWSKELQFSLSEKLKDNIESSKATHILEAILLGKKDDLESIEKESFSNSGTMHILAVSGLHVGILLLILSFPFKFFKQENKLPHVVFVLTCIWIYAFVTGLSPSVLRATTMFSFILIGHLRKKSSTTNAIYISAILLILITPSIIYDVGFQLSYAAVLGIVVLSPKLEKWINYYPENKILLYFYQILVISIIAQISTAPLCLYYFHQLPTYFLLSNLIAIPLAFILVFLGTLFFISSVFLPYALSFIGLLLNTVSQLLYYTTSFISQLPFSTINNISINQIEVVLLILLILLFFRVIIDKRSKTLYILFLLLCFLSYINIKEEYDFRTKESVTIFNMKSNSCIMLFKQKKVHCLTDIKSPAFNNKVDYITANFTYKLNSQPTFSPIPKGLTIYNLGSYKIGVLKTKEAKTTIPLDALIVTNSSITLENVYRNFNVKKIVFDSSNNKDFINCIKHSPRLNNHVHIVPIEGAITINF